MCEAFKPADARELQQRISPWRNCLYPLKAAERHGARLDRCAEAVGFVGDLFGCSEEVWSYSWLSMRRRTLCIVSVLIIISLGVFAIFARDLAIVRVCLVVCC